MVGAEVPKLSQISRISRNRIGAEAALVGQVSKKFLEEHFVRGLEFR